MPTPSLGRVVIIDDNHDLADLFAAIVDILGYETKSAYSGAAGLQLIAEFVPQVIFCDINMQGMTGYEVAEHVNKLELMPPPLLIAVTGWSDDNRLKRIESAGFAINLIKPVNFDLVKTLLAEHFENKR